MAAGLQVQVGGGAAGAVAASAQETGPASGGTRLGSRGEEGCLVYPGVNGGGGRERPRQHGPGAGGCSGQLGRVVFSLTPG